MSYSLYWIYSVGDSSDTTMFSSCFISGRTFIDGSGSGRYGYGRDEAGTICFSASTVFRNVFFTLSLTFNITVVNNNGLIKIERISNDNYFRKSVHVTWKKGTTFEGSLHYPHIVLIVYVKIAYHKTVMIEWRAYIPTFIFTGFP